MNPYRSSPRGPSHHPAGVLVLAANVLLGAGVLLAGAASCGPLSPAAETALEAVNAAACPALGLIPSVGGYLVLACPGEEVLVHLALQHAASHPDGGQVPGPQTDPAASSAPALVHRRAGAARARTIGYVPPELAHLAPGAQAWLDAHPELEADGGALEGGPEAGR